MIHKYKFVFVLLVIYVVNWGYVVQGNLSMFSKHGVSRPEIALTHKVSNRDQYSVLCSGYYDRFVNNITYVLTKSVNHTKSDNDDFFKIIISTSTGLEGIDNSIELIINPNFTFRQLKEEIRDRFPGNPPTFLQKLIINNTTITCTPETKLNEIKSFKEVISQNGVISLILDMFTVPISLKIDSLNNLNQTNKSGKIIAYLLIIDRLLRQLDSGISGYPLYNSQDQSTRLNSFSEQGHSDILNKDLYEKMIKIKDFIKKSNLTEDFHEYLESLEIAYGGNNTLTNLNQYKISPCNVAFPHTLKQRIFEKFSINFNIQWKPTSKLAILLLYLHHFGPDYEHVKKGFILTIPTVFLLQTRPLRLARKFLRNSLPRSNIWQGFNFILSTSQQELFI